MLVRSNAVGVSAEISCSQNRRLKDEAVAWRNALMHITRHHQFSFPSHLKFYKGLPAFWCMANGGKFKVWLDSEKCFVRMKCT